MRIVEVAVFQHQLPVRGGPFRIASSEVSSLDTTLVRLTTDDHLVGWGETCPVGPTYQPHHARGARAALDEVAPALIGCDPLKLLSLHRTMDGRLEGHRYAKAATDIAAHDVAGKRLGLRVADLLGGAVVERVPSYFSSGIGPPDETAEIASERAAEGYPRMQVKVGGRPIETDIEVVRMVWERWAPGCGWPSTAIAA